MIATFTRTSRCHFVVSRRSSTSTSSSPRRCLTARRRRSTADTRCRSEAERRYWLPSFSLGRLVSTTSTTLPTSRRRCASTECRTSDNDSRPTFVAVSLDNRTTSDSSSATASASLSSVHTTYIVHCMYSCHEQSASDKVNRRYL